MLNHKRGFTLAELMTVVAVSAILMAVAIPTFIGAKNRSRAQACRANLQIINSAIKEWALDNPSVPGTRLSDSDTTNNVVYVSDIKNYIDGGFASLEEPTTGNARAYTTGDGDATLEDTDTVGAITGTSTSPVLPTPACSTGLSGHSL